MSKYKPYPKYKDSGVEWLGLVPEEWEVKRLKYLAKLLSAKTNESSLCIGLENIESWTGRFIHADDVFEMGGVAFQIDDILYGKLRPYLAKVYVAKSSGNAIGDFHVLRPLQCITAEYLACLLRTKECVSISNGSTYGAKMPRVSWEFLGNLCFPLPSAEEQKRIVTFLDHELSHIDSIISKQQHLVELLEEKRISIISHAVTKGLNPDVPMKDSDIGWIGAAPTHWDLIRIKHLFAIKKRIAGTLGFDVLSITQKGIQIKDLEANTGQFSMDYSKYQLVERGDFAMNHMDLLTGFVDISNYEGVTSPDYRVFSLLDRKNYVALYFLYIFQNAYLNKIFYSLGQGVSHFGRWRLQTEQFNDFVLPVPPKDEQKAIVDYLEGELSKIDAIINKTRQAIALAKERRAAIISAAVTGKICVCRPQSVEKPLSKSLEYFQKVVLAAEITDQLHMERTFGRVKLQKILYLSEYHAQLPFQRSEYQRYAAGPHDPKAMYSIEGQMKKQKWFDSRLRESGYGKEYVPLERHEAYKPYYERYFAEKHEVIQRIIDLLRTKDTQFCEVVATLYGIWNDFLLEGQQLDDAAMFREAVTNWAPEKKKVPPGLWPKALHWMRENNLVPSGWGEPTIHRQKA